MAKTYTKTQILENYRSQISTNRNDAALKSLIIIYNFQTSVEKEDQETKCSNGRGFGAFDAKILTDLAEKYLTYHKLRPNQLAIVQKKMVKYVGQLFDNALETNKIRKLTRCSYEIVR